MADDLKDRGAADRSRVNVNEEHEIAYWTERLQVSRQRLRAAVKKVGPMVADVQRELSGQ